MKKDIIIPVISLLLICLVSSALLGGVNMITKDRIADLAAQTVVEAKSELIPAASYEDKDLDGTAYSVALDENGKVLGYIFTTSANGYGGAVKLMTGIDLHGKVTGVSLLEINETPGLGMKAKNESFLQQFVDASGILTVVKDGSSAPGTVQAITSATITTKAVTSAVNKALGIYESIKEAELNG
ncbi:MAG: RnfABCDGE type electron transport complex subunit G [Ruminococcaceae bacterium]|nr:RnfABCDGE type electron transport complex subunit G [Oscillospiraceae bacterium]